MKLAACPSVAGGPSVHYWHFKNSQVITLLSREAMGNLEIDLGFHNSVGGNMGLKRIILSLAVGVFTLFSAGSAQAQWSSYTTATGLARLKNYVGSYDYRLSLIYSAIEGSGVRSKQSFFPIAGRDKFTVTPVTQSSDRFIFSIPFNNRFDLTAFIPANGQLRIGGLIYSASHRRSDYANYVSRIGTGYNCTLSIDAVGNTTPNTVVPILSCLETVSDISRIITVVVDPTNARIQEMR